MFIACLRVIVKYRAIFQDLKVSTESLESFSMRKYVFFISLLVVITPFAYADVATHCLSLGSGYVSQTLTNNCNYKIEMVWCHTFEGHGYKKGFCNNNGQFYQLHSILEPGEVKESPYSLSNNSTIHYAACAGSNYALKQSGMEGRVHCK